MTHYDENINKVTIKNMLSLLKTIQLTENISTKLHFIAIKKKTDNL